MADEGIEEDKGDDEEVGEEGGARVIAGAYGCGKSPSTSRKFSVRGDVLGTGRPNEP